MKCRPNLANGAKISTTCEAKHLIGHFISVGAGRREIEENEDARVCSEESFSETDLGSTEEECYFACMHLAPVGREWTDL